TCVTNHILRPLLPLSSLTPSAVLLFISFFFLLILQPPRSTLFPYTTLFRSVRALRARCERPGDRRGHRLGRDGVRPPPPGQARRDRKSTRLNSSHVAISYAVFCLKKKNYTNDIHEFSLKHHSVYIPKVCICA